MIYIASDHGGFHLKRKILEQIKEMDLDIKDVGSNEFNPNDDYPDFVIPLVKSVLKDNKNRGIVICKNGVGVSITANRFKGIRCGLSWNTEHIKTAREDDNINVLALPSEFIDTKKALEIIGEFLNTKFSNKDRHVRRLAKIEQI